MSRALVAQQPAKCDVAAPAEPPQWRPVIHPLARVIDEGEPYDDPQEEREADAAFANLQFRLATRAMYGVAALGLAVVFVGDLVEGVLR